MKDKYQKMLSYLDYLINDSKLDAKEIDSLKELNMVVVSLSKLKFVEEEVYNHNRVSLVDKRIMDLLKKYQLEREELKQKLSLNVLNYGSERLSFLENAIEQLIIILNNKDADLEKIIEKNLNYVSKKKEKLLNRVYSDLGITNKFSRFFGYPLIKRNEQTNQITIVEDSVKQIYDIMSQGEQFTRLEQTVRLKRQLDNKKEEKKRIDLIIKYYNYINVQRILRMRIEQLDSQISELSNECNDNIDQLIKDRNFYNSLPFGQIIFQSKIDNLNTKIREYWQNKKYADKLYKVRIDYDFKKSKIDTYLSTRNVHFVFDEEFQSSRFNSKDEFVLIQNQMSENINQLSIQLNQEIASLNDINRRLFKDDIVTCNNIIFGLRDNQNLFISFYILIILIYSEYINKQDENLQKAPSELINSIITEYEEKQNQKISNIHNSHDKVFNLKR